VGRGECSLKGVARCGAQLSLTLLNTAFGMSSPAKPKRELAQPTSITSAPVSSPQNMVYLDGGRRATYLYDPRAALSKFVPSHAGGRVKSENARRLPTALLIHLTKWWRDRHPKLFLHLAERQGRRSALF
jgi:hypothetical protein